MTAKDLSILTAKIVGLTIVLIAANGFGTKLLPAIDAGSQAVEPASGSFFGILILVMLLQTVALAYPIVRSRWSGWRLTGAVFVLFFGTVTFMSQIESVVYLGDRMPEGMQAGIFEMGLFVAAVFAPIAVLVLGRWKSKAGEGSPDAWRPRAGWWGRVVAGGGVFLALYYLFGYYVAWQSPALRDYYGGTDPGSFLAQMANVVRDTPWMLPLQFVRGLLWVALAVLVIRMMRGRRWEAALALALLFGVPSLYLLFPNPLMPDAVRFAHLVETLPYQLLFGAFAGWWLGKRSAHTNNSVDPTKGLHPSSGPV